MTNDSTTAKIATIGMFDGVHLGHRHLIASLKSHAQNMGYHTAVVTFNNHPRNVLSAGNSMPLLMERNDCMATIMAAGVDEVIMLDFTTELASLSATDFMKMLRDNHGVKAILMGYNHSFGHDRSASLNDYKQWASQLGMTIVNGDEFSSNGNKVSSSAIRNLIANCNVDEAATMLGRPFSIKGTVVHGAQNGRKIGFPTANVCPSNGIITPGNGVYAVWVNLKGKRYRGMCNIGNRPTVGNNLQRSIEVNIFDFNADIYGAAIEVEFVALTRHEQRFSGLEALKLQLQADKHEINQILDN